MKTKKHVRENVLIKKNFFGIGLRPNVKTQIRSFTALMLDIQRGQNDHQNADASKN